MKWVKRVIKHVPLWKIRQTVLKMCRKARETGQGVGYCLAQYLMKFDIRYDTDDGCNCYRLMLQMNSAGPDAIEANIEYWTEQVHKSSQKWYRRYVEGEEPAEEESIA